MLTIPSLEEKSLFFIKISHFFKLEAFEQKKLWLYHLQCFKIEIRTNYEEPNINISTSLTKKTLFYQNL